MRLKANEQRLFRHYEKGGGVLLDKPLRMFDPPLETLGCDTPHPMASVLVGRSTRPRHHRHSSHAKECSFAMLKRDFGVNWFNNTKHPEARHSSREMAFIDARNYFCYFSIFKLITRFQAPR